MKIHREMLTLILRMHLCIPFRIASLSHPTPMVPFARRPINLSIVAIHAKRTCSSHIVEDCSSGALSTGTSPVCISMIESRPFDIVNFHPTSQFPSFSDPSNPATTVMFLMARRSLWIFFLVSHLVSPIFLFSRLSLGQSPPVLSIVLVGVVGLKRSHLTCCA